MKSVWLWIGVVIVVIVIILYVRQGSSSVPTFEYSSSAVGNVVEQVSVTGTVSPVDKADLAFEKSGVVTLISVKVGDMVKNGDTIATLDASNDQAAVASAKATLADMSRSLTPQELAVQQTSLDNAKSDAVNAAHDGLAKAQSAVFSYTDSFFNNPQGSNPTIFIHTDTYNEALSFNAERLTVTAALGAWASDLAVANPDPAALVASARSHLSVIKSFMTDLSVVVNELSTANSNMTQTAINAYIATMNAGLSAVNADIDSVTAAQTGLLSAQSAYNLKLSGNSAESIAAQAAKVAQAEALLAEDTLVSPIDGIVTKADPSVGEFVGAGASGFSVQNSDFKVAAYVPEADIAKVAVGDLASSTLDAYGSYVDFPATVTAIDPAETVLEGVPTYKVTLMFVQPDARIRSGMTSNLEILTHEAVGVVEIPFRAVVTTATSTTVRVVSKDGKSYSSVPITVGLKGSDGTIEIVSGLSTGEKVVTYVK